ncbi:carboxypeptidase regulatory-like domain-containing protein [Arthrobacter sp. R4-81]
MAGAGIPAAADGWDRYLEGTVSAPPGTRMDLLRVALSDFDSPGAWAEVPLDASGRFRLPYDFQLGYTALRVLPGETGLADTWFGNAPRLRDATRISLQTRDYRGLNITMAPGATISGSVSVPAGFDASKLAVVAESKHITPNDRADTEVKKSVPLSLDGTFQIDGLAANDYKVRVEPGESGLLTTWYGGATEDAAATPVSLAEGETRNGLGIGLQKPASVSGKVGFPNGVAPGPGSVFASSALGTTVSTATFDASGEFTLRQLPPGPLTLGFNSLDPALASTTWHPGTFERATAETLVLNEGEERTGVAVTMLGAGSISGHVTGGTGRMVVQAVDSLGKPLRQSLVDTAGNYAITRIAPGTYKIRFTDLNPSWERQVAPQFYPGVPSRQAGTGVVVTAGAATGGIDFQATPGTSISGIVLGETGQPVPNAVVRAIPVDGGQERHLETDSSGRFQLLGLPDADFILKTYAHPAYIRGVRWRVIYSGNVTERSKAQVITIGGGQAIDVGALSFETTGRDPSEAAGKFHAVTPTRVLDTRVTPGPLNDRGTQVVEIGGRYGIPADATAVAVNVTVTEPQSQGHASATAFGASVWDTSTVNYDHQETVPNYSVVPMVDGKIVIGINSGSSGKAHLIADVAGYFTGGGSAALPGTYSPLTPFRAVDSRNSGGVAGGQTLNVQVAGSGGVPAGAAAVVVNITAARLSGDTWLNYGHLTAFASGTTRPGTSNVNYDSYNGDVPNMAVVPVGADGKISIANSSPGKAGVIVDVMGYFLPGASTAEGSYQPLVPTRLKDTRLEPGPVHAWRDVSIPIGGTRGIPAGAKAAMVNLTVTEPSAAGHLTAYPSRTALPGVSNVNFTKGLTVANFAIVPIGADGRITVRNSSTGPIHLVVDVFGYVR